MGKCDKYFYYLKGLDSCEPCEALCDEYEKRNTLNECKEKCKEYFKNLIEPLLQKTLSSPDQNTLSPITDNTTTESSNYFLDIGLPSLLGLLIIALIIGIVIYKKGLCRKCQRKNRPIQVSADGTQHVTEEEEAVDAERDTMLALTVEETVEDSGIQSYEVSPEISDASVNFRCQIGT